MDDSIPVDILRGLNNPVQYISECSDFLDKMKQSSSFALVKSIKNFIDIFMGNQSSAAEQSEMIKQFMMEMHHLMSEHSLWREESEEALQVAIEALERYLMYKIFKVAFYIPSTNDLEMDSKFYHCARVHHFLQPHHLDIEHTSMHQLVFRAAADELRQLDAERFKAPRERLCFILNAVTLLSNLIKHTSGQIPGADDLLPYIIYTLILAAPRHVYSNIRYIQRFRQPSQLYSEAVYFLTQLESAVVFVETINHSVLTISEEEYIRAVEESQMRIQNGEENLSSLRASPRSLSRDSSFSSLTPSPFLVPDLDGPGRRTPALNAPLIEVNGKDLMTFNELEEVVAPSTPYLSTLSSSSGTEATTITMDNIGIKEKFLRLEFDELTVGDFKELLQSYREIATRLMTHNKQ